MKFEICLFQLDLLNEKSTKINISEQIGDRNINLNKGANNGNFVNLFPSFYNKLKHPRS